MKIYLATPVNGRKEKTLLLRQKQAYKRIVEMAHYVRKRYPDAEFQSSFDIPAVIGSSEEQEAAIMGECVRKVMECDMIVLDDGWENSQGCSVERFVAMQYCKSVHTIAIFQLKDKLMDCITEPTVGKWYMCIEEVINDDDPDHPEVWYEAGTAYKCEQPHCITDEKGDKGHEWSSYGVGGFIYENFREATDAEVKWQLNKEGVAEC